MIGNVVGNYQIGEQIGEGGMGAVFKGFDLMLEREVAIKVLRPELAHQPQVVERFRAEAVTLARLNHPQIATLYSFLRHGDDFLMVMEFVRGETLEAVIHRQGAIPLARALGWFGQVLEAMAHAHGLGIVHRDLKPSNLMLAETGAIKVMDFGIARLLSSARMTQTGRIVGTIEYMSPEQIRGQEADGRADLYSLGIVLYEMLTGQVPFRSHSEYELMRAQVEDPPPPPRTFAAHLPSSIEQVILGALAKHPAERFQTAAEFRAALGASAREAGITPEVVITSPAQPAPPPRPSADRAMPGALPETRLAGGAAGRVSGRSEAWPGRGDQSIKETRLPQPGTGHSAEPDRMSGAQAGQLSFFASLFSQFNSPLRRPLTWKHYAGVAIALIVLASLAGLLAREKRPAITTPPVTSQSAPVPADTPAPAEVPSAPSAADPSARQPLPEPVVIPGNPQPWPGEMTTSAASQPTRPRPAGKRRGAPPTAPAAAATTSAATSSHAAAAAPRPTPQPAREQAREAEEPDRGPRKDKEHKSDQAVKAASEIVSGAKGLFSLFKGGDKKHKDKDRDEKKSKKREP
jgi:serine/threonine-protein kinase